MSNSCCSSCPASTAGARPPEPEATRPSLAARWPFTTVLMQVMSETTKSERISRTVSYTHLTLPTICSV
eukprot:13321608-Alexandrium_andersonii.AAC.1